MDALIFVVLMKKRIVLAGLGKMGRNHLRVILENPKFELVAVVEPNSNNHPRNLAPSVRLLTSLDQLSDVNFDCAVIATPTQTHYEAAKTILGFKKDLLLEKPIASTLKQAEELIALAEKNGCKFFIGHLERFNPAVLKLKEVIDQGMMGQAIHFSFTRIGGYPETVADGNNVLLDLAVHDLDVFRFLTGDAKVHSSVCHSTFKAGISDTAEILLKGASGCTASMHVNWVSPTKIRSIRVTGTRGVCMVDYILQTCTMYGGNFLKRAPEPLETDFQKVVEHYRNSDRLEFGIEKKEPLKVQLEHFYSALCGIPSQICTARDGYQAVALAQTAMSRAEEA